LGAGVSPAPPFGTSAEEELRGPHALVPNRPSSPAGYLVVGGGRGPVDAAGQEIVQDVGMHDGLAPFSAQQSFSTRSFGEAVPHILQSPMRSPTAQDRVYSEPRPHSRTTPHGSGARDSMRKSKLPHGLTVQELKEMTKARLQSEAAEQTETQDMGQAASVPSTVKVVSDYASYDPHSRNAVQPSPIPFHGGRAARSPFPDSVDAYGRSLAGPSRDAWSLDSRGEAFETASVSTVASDFMGSEYSGNMNGGYGGELGPIAFGRSRSSQTATSPLGLPYDSAFTSPNHYPFDAGYSGSRRRANTEEHYHDQSYGANRRRAATYSPRTNLSNVHEDRAELHDFASTVTSLPMQPSDTLTNSSLFDPGVQDAADVVNRQRAWSVNSLPTTSSEIDRSRFSSQFTSVREESTPSLVTGLADVFSSSGLNSGVAAPGAAGIKDFDPRSRAATWGEPSMDMFGPGLIGKSDSLSEEFATLLKLSLDDQHPVGKSLGAPPPPGF